MRKWVKSAFKYVLLVGGWLIAFCGQVGYSEFQSNVYSWLNAMGFSEIPMLFKTRAADLVVTAIGAALFLEAIAFYTFKERRRRGATYIDLKPQKRRRISGFSVIAVVSIFAFALLRFYGAPDHPLPGTPIRNFTVGDGPARLDLHIDTSMLAEYQGGYGVIGLCRASVPGGPEWKYDRYIFNSKFKMISEPMVVSVLIDQLFFRRLCLSKGVVECTAILADKDLADGFDLNPGQATEIDPNSRIEFEGYIGSDISDWVYGCNAV